MYLLNTSTLQLSAFFEPNTPDYAILSHRWEDGEVSFADICNGVAESKPGFAKVKGCCDLALSEGWQYAWIDSCCIDKSSSAEISEAINSMFKFYENSQVCYAYLSDVASGFPYDLDTNGFHGSRWFTRGWTLQELLAPPMVVFYSRGWVEIGTRRSLQKSIAKITNIKYDFTRWRRASAAQKMSWVARRQTTRIEDMAYCMLGLFGVYMAILYGEGQNAFLRLQLEIISQTDDESIFAWADSGIHWLGTSTSGLLAHSPGAFRNSGDIVAGSLTNRRPNYTMTNHGLKMERLTVLKATQNTLRVILNCSQTGSTDSHLGIHLARVDGDQYQRTRCSELVFWDKDVADEFRILDNAVFVKQLRPPQPILHENITFSIDVSSVLQHGFESVLLTDVTFPSFEGANGVLTLAPGLVDSLVQDQAGAVFAYHHRISGDVFAVTVDIIDEQVGVNIVLTRGTRYLASMKFQSLFCDRGGSVLGYEPFDQRRLDRASRMLDSGRSVSVALRNVRMDEGQCYFVEVVVRPPGEALTWPDDEGEQYIITDELYDEFLRSGGSNNKEVGHRPGNRVCSWNRVRRLANKERAAELS